MLMDVEEKENQKIMNLFESDDYTTIVMDSHEQWLKERGKGIGGSDAAAVIGMSPWKSLQELWREKKYGAEEISNYAIKYGTEAEAPLRKLFTLKHPELDVQHMDDVTLESNENRFMRYSPDGLLYDKDTGRKGILEIKTSMINSSMAYQNWKDDKVPDQYYIQTLHGLLVTKFDFVIYTAELRFVDGSSKIIERSYQTKDVQDDLEILKNKEIEVWNEYFLADKEPPFQFDL
ncbi:recombinase [Absicoccus porci]|uniref:Recombinase n=2 Tax=Absicoccus porci TaxID=2486576 RepID=A0A3N0I277_9FIRM|nr:recombinase [Absicoccus porci]